MSKPLSEMTPEELWALFPIILSEHKSCWLDWYEEEKRTIAALLPDQNIKIRHIGSTAIPHIWAKPIIDILIEIPFDTSMMDIREILVNNGYICMSAAENRVSLNKGYTSRGFAERVFHIHLRYDGDHDELYFRDYLNDHPVLAEKYEQLKLSLWEKYEHDRDAYTRAKGAFVKEYTDAAKAEYGNKYESGANEARYKGGTRMIRNYDGKIVLADGSEYPGCRFGAKGNRVCELVFNTSMVGYQEIVSDPSYTGQLVVMTYPIIGNYGVTDEDFETKIPTIGGLVVREYNDIPSNFRYTKTLSEILEDHGIPAIEGIDTRKLTRAIRDEGSQKVLLTDMDTPVEEAVALLNATELRHDQVSQVSCKKRWYSRTSNHRYTVVAVYCGIKLNIVRSLNARGCNVTVVPYDTPYQTILDMEPDGVFLSNGPGDPEDVTPVIELVRRLRGKFPIFGICLGHQMIALAYGGRTYKLKFGHRGGNHPVKDLSTGKLEITSQNHSYAVDAASLEGTGLEVTHVNVLDNTVEGLACKEDKVFSVQYHPESAPGPQDSGYLFDRFIQMMEEAKRNA